MNNYKVTWYEGSIDTNQINKILNEVILQSDEIDNVNATVVLPDSYADKIKYCRYLLFSEDKLTIDYGDYSKFILVELDK